MGRGRQKAKHQKVARELKYHTSAIDTSALERELSTGSDGGDYTDRYSDLADDSDDDPYAEYADEDDADEA